MNMAMGMVAAMVKAQSTLNTHSRYLHEGILDFIDRLVGLHPNAPIESVIVSCSGTEAIEVAARIDGWAGRADRVELAVVGAHLRGEPLHHQLVDLDARYDLSSLGARGAFLQLNVQNLTDKRYFDQVYTSHMAHVAPGRTALLSTNFHF